MLSPSHLQATSALDNKLMPFCLTAKIIVNIASCLEISGRKKKMTRHSALWIEMINVRWIGLTGGRSEGTTTTNAFRDVKRKRRLTSSTRSGRAAVGLRWNHSVRVLHAFITRSVSSHMRRVETQRWQFIFSPDQFNNRKSWTHCCYWLRFAPNVPLIHKDGAQRSNGTRARCINEAFRGYGSEGWPTSLPSLSAMTMA